MLLLFSISCIFDFSLGVCFQDCHWYFFNIGFDISAPMWTGAFIIFIIIFVIVVVVMRWMVRGIIGSATYFLPPHHSNSSGRYFVSFNFQDENNELMIGLDWYQSKILDLPLDRTKVFPAPSVSIDWLPFGLFRWFSSEGTSKAKQMHLNVFFVMFGDTHVFWCWSWLWFSPGVSKISWKYKNKSWHLASWLCVSLVRVSYPALLSAAVPLSSCCCRDPSVCSQTSSSWSSRWPPAHWWHRWLVHADILIAPQPRCMHTPLHISWFRSMQIGYQSFISF